MQHSSPAPEKAKDPARCNSCSLHVSTATHPGHQCLACGCSPVHTVLHQLLAQQKRDAHACNKGTRRHGCTSNSLPWKQH